LGRAFSDVTDSMKQFTASAENIISFAKGGTGTTSVVNNSARVADPSKFFDSAKFTQIITSNIINNEALQGKNRTSTQTIGKEFGQTVIDSQKAIQDLPGILLNLRNGIGSFDSKKAVSQLVDQFERSSDLVKDAIQVAADNIIGPEGKEVKLIEAITNDLDGTNKKLGAVLQKQVELAAQIVKANSEEKDRRLKFIDQLTRLNQQEISLRDQRLVAQRNIEEIRARGARKPVNLDRLQNIENQRRANLGVTGGPAAIAVQTSKRLKIN